MQAPSSAPGLGIRLPRLHGLPWRRRSHHCLGPGRRGQSRDLGPPRGRSRAASPGRRTRRPAAASTRMSSERGRPRATSLREGGTSKSATDLFSDGENRPDRGRCHLPRTTAARAWPPPSSCGRRGGPGLGATPSPSRSPTTRTGQEPSTAARLRADRPHLELPQEARPRRPYVSSRRAGRAPASAPTRPRTDRRRARPGRERPPS